MQSEPKLLLQAAAAPQKNDAPSTSLSALDDFIQLSGLLRCERCQERETRCIINRSDTRCMVCEGADSGCIFSRVVKRTAVRTDFAWEEIRGDGLPDYSFAKFFSDPPGMSSDVLSKPAMEVPIKQVNSPSDSASCNSSEVCWRTSTSSNDTSLFSGFRISKSNMEHLQVPPRKRRLNAESKEHAARVRSVGACLACRTGKRKVSMPFPLMLLQYRIC